MVHIFYFTLDRKLCFVECYCLDMLSAFATHWVPSLTKPHSELFEMRVDRAGILERIWLVCIFKEN